MKKYNRIMAVSVFLYLAMAACLGFYSRNNGTGTDLSYKVEVNRIMRGLENAGVFSKPDLRGAKSVKDVRFLSADETDVQKIRLFYGNRNGMCTAVHPLLAGERLLGYVRFDYVETAGNQKILWFVEGLLFFAWSAVFALLWYIRQMILKPFHVLSEMPYEMAQGHLRGELLESENRYFGKFVWGLGMLRDTLSLSKARELKLEREKKLLLLSVSHDIKIPLSAIKLYAKALREKVYETEEERLCAAARIEKHAKEIENYVKEIMSAASEDIAVPEVENTEFYLKDFMDKVRACYEPKCRLTMTDFVIGQYGNRLVKGDLERAFEVMENLMENALKYGDGKEIRIDFYEEDYCQVISVYNTGAPVPGEEMPHLFDSFYRGSNAGNRSGNGLGLYIGRQLMLKMEGEIFAQRAEDGMRFGMVLSC